VKPSSIAIALLACVAFAAGAQAGDADGAPWYRGKLSATAGFSFSEGDYGGSDDTQVWYVPFSFKYSFRELGLTPRDRIDLKATIPYLRITGPEGARFDLDGEVAPGSGGSESHDGLGDVALSAKYIHVADRNLPVVGISTKLKIPTGSASEGLGGGRVDVTLSGEISQSFVLPREVLISPFAELGYRFRDGRSDQLRASAGLSVRPHRRLDVGAAYQFAETSSGTRDRHEVSLFASGRISEALRLEPFAIIGLSQSSADFGAGLALRFSFEIGD
jgi:hypothetical protein